jgi:hypothetical protein
MLVNTGDAGKKEKKVLFSHVRAYLGLKKLVLL